MPSACPPSGPGNSHVRRVHSVHMAGVEQLVVHGDEHSQPILQLILVDDTGARRCRAEGHEGTGMCAPRCLCHLTLP